MVYIHQTNKSEAIFQQFIVVVRSFRRNLINEYKLYIHFGRSSISFRLVGFFAFIFHITAKCYVSGNYT